MTEYSKSGEHYADPDCGPRLNALEKRVDDHSGSIKAHAALHQQNAVDRMASSKDMQAVVIALETLTRRVEQVLASQGVNVWHEVQKAAIFWAVPICGTAAFWVLTHSGAVK